MAEPYNKLMLKMIAPTKDAPHGKTITGHVIGGVYKSSYWGHTYKVLGPSIEENVFPNGVKVEMIEDSPNMVNSTKKPGDIWTHATQVDRDKLLRVEDIKPELSTSSPELPAKKTDSPSIDLS